MPRVRGAAQTLFHAAAKGQPGRIAWLAVLALVGCGTRTGLEAGGAPQGEPRNRIDAGPRPPDAAVRTIAPGDVNTGHRAPLANVWVDHGQRPDDGRFDLTLGVLEPEGRLRTRTLRRDAPLVRGRSAWGLASGSNGTALAWAERGRGAVRLRLMQLGDEIRGKPGETEVGGVTDAAALDAPPAGVDLVAAGDGLVAAWVTEGVAYARRLEMSGRVVGPAMALGPAQRLSLAGQQDRVAVTRLEGGRLTVDLLHRQDLRLTGTKELAEEAASQARVVAVRDRFAVSYVHQRRLRVAFVGRGGRLHGHLDVASACGDGACGPATRPGGGLYGMASAVAAVDEVGVLYMDDPEREPRLFLARVARTGTIRVRRVEIAGGPGSRLMEPVLGWDGTRYVASWRSTASRGFVEAYVAVDRVGAVHTHPRIAGFDRHPEVTRLPASPEP